MSLKKTPAPLLIEPDTIQADATQSKLENSTPWFSEPWGIGLAVAIVISLGLVIYLAGFFLFRR